MKKTLEKPIVSIGLPIFNSEQFLQNRIENLLSQTYTNFELIISDNASTDNSVTICKKFMEKDSRIKLHIQEKNIGQFENYNFVLKKSIGKYFLWVAADDFLESEFLEKNVNVLDSKKEFVTSVSKLKMFGRFTDELNKKQKSFLKKNEQKLKSKLSHMDCFPISGNYETRISKFLKTCRHSQVFYGLHRTDELKKCVFDKFIMGFDTFYALRLLKYGGINVVNEKLMHVYDGGDSRTGMIKISKMVNNSIFGILFPWIPTTRMFKNEIGWKLFIKNIWFFIKLNISGGFSLFVDICRKI